MLTAGPQQGERAVHGLKIDVPPSQGSVGMLQCLPGLYLIENLKKDGAKENFAWLLRAVGAILDLTYKVLTDAVSNTENVCKPISS